MWTCFIENRDDRPIEGQMIMANPAYKQQSVHKDDEHVAAKKAQTDSLRLQQSQDEFLQWLERMDTEAHQDPEIEDDKIIRYRGVR